MTPPPGPPKLGPKWPSAGGSRGPRKRGSRRRPGSGDLNSCDFLDSWPWRARGGGPGRPGGGPGGVRRGSARGPGGDPAGPRGAGRGGRRDRRTLAAGTPRTPDLTSGGPGNTAAVSGSGGSRSPELEQHARGKIRRIRFTVLLLLGLWCARLRTVAPHFLRRRCTRTITSAKVNCTDWSGLILNAAGSAWLFPW